ncbi:hypothetical protein pb186bvf_020674 [Paramecium bursaria]
MCVMRILSKRFGRNKIKKYFLSDSKQTIDLYTLTKGRENQNIRKYQKIKFEPNNNLQKRKNLSMSHCKKP